MSSLWKNYPLVEFTSRLSRAYPSVFDFELDGYKVIHFTEGRQWVVECDNCGQRKKASRSQIAGNKVLNCRSCKDMAQNKGITEHPHYTRYSSMITRCYYPSSPSFKNYGGRGIYVCDEWLEDKLKFLYWCEKHFIDPETTLDRRDNDGPYSPSNCRFSTWEVQHANKRA